MTDAAEASPHKMVARAGRALWRKTNAYSIEQNF